MYLICKSEVGIWKDVNSILIVDSQVIRMTIWFSLSPKASVAKSNSLSLDCQDDLNYEELVVEMLSLYYCKTYLKRGQVFFGLQFWSSDHCEWDTLLWSYGGTVHYHGSRWDSHTDHLQHLRMLLFQIRYKTTKWPVRAQWLHHCSFSLSLGIFERKKSILKLKWQS